MVGYGYVSQHDMHKENSAHRYDNLAGIVLIIGAGLPDNTV